MQPKESDWKDSFEDDSTKKPRRKVVPLFPNPSEEYEDEKGELLKDEDLNFIYTGASDKRGHSVVTQCRLKPWIPRQIQIIVESGKLSYKTSSDFIRDAIYWRIKHWVKEFEDKEGMALLNAKTLSEALAQESEITAILEQDLIVLRLNCEQYR